MSVITRGTVLESSAFKLYGQVYKADGTFAVAADISEIEYSVFDLSDIGTAVDSGPLSPSDVIKASPETVDGKEFNLVWSPDVSLIDEGNRTRRFEVVVTPQTGEPFAFVWELVVENLLGS